MFKLFLFASVIFGLAPLCNADQLSEKIDSLYMVHHRNQQAVSLYLMKNYNIDHTKKDQIDLMVQTRRKVEDLVADEWTKSFNKEFTAKEREYLKTLYDSPLMKKLFIFNDNFTSRKEVENILKTNFDKNFKRIKAGKN